MKTALAIPALLMAAALMACGPGSTPADTGTGNDATSNTDTGTGGDTGAGGGLTLSGGVRTCTPGTMVVAGCNQGCAMPLGMCSGDPVMRICPGSASTEVCTAAMEIDSNDDGLSSMACGGSSDAGLEDPMGAVNVRLCPVVEFMCPTDGMYTIWTGGFGTRMAMCTPAVR